MRGKAGPRAAGPQRGEEKRVGPHRGLFGLVTRFGFPFLFYSISKTNKQSLNSNTTLNSDHTQIIKTMHQHECDTKKKLNL